MVNAGVELMPFDGNQHYDYSGECWKGITAKINFPPGQNYNDNLPSAGDVLIEENGQVWHVLGVTGVSPSGNTVRFDIRLTSAEPIEDNLPGMGSTRRGGVITPNNGFIAPYWNTTYVDANVSRIAAMITMENMGALWNGDVDLKDAPEDEEGQTDENP